MAGKRQHMSKHEYQAKYRHTRKPFTDDRWDDESRQVKSRAVTERKKRETTLKKHLQSIQRYSEDLSDDE